MNSKKDLIADNEDWDLVIKPKSKFFDLQLKEVWRYRDLLVLFVKRDFKAQYKQTILGPLWHIIQPVFTTIMFVVIFDKIANIHSTGCFMHWRSFLVSVVLTFAFVSISIYYFRKMERSFADNI